MQFITANFCCLAKTSNTSVSHYAKTRQNTRAASLSSHTLVWGVTVFKSRSAGVGTKVFFFFSSQFLSDLQIQHTTSIANAHNLWADTIPFFKSKPFGAREWTVWQQISGLWSIRPNKIIKLTLFSYNASYWLPTLDVWHVQKVTVRSFR